MRLLLVRRFAFGAYVTYCLWGGAGCHAEASPSETLKLGDHRAEVPYPPPAALPEVVPRSPSNEAVWLDGHWIWRAQTWIWQRGGWVVPSRKAVYVRWQLDYEEDGRLLFYPGGWWTAAGQPLPDPQIIRPATHPPTSTTSLEAAAQ